ncbi:heme exporter protein CcmB [uncultured Leclercia sp.]|uniref:heme exporter protein CcmB n=1 Tax=uncultured Leclercia sp. TaxID=332959 RepID=UPI0025950896|nr:heme exporter protein CcmB [uncultured Leclercia sp.]
MIGSLFMREMAIALRYRSELANPLWFFIIILTLFPLAIGPEPAQLARMAPGIVWVAALLASSLTQDRLFRDDYREGSLEQLLLLPVPLPLVVATKIAAQALVSGGPLLMLSPVAMVLLGLDVYGWQVLALTLLLGIPALCFLAAPCVALTVSLPRGGVLLSVLVLPLTLPLLIFAVGAVECAVAGLPVAGHLAALGALLAGSATLSPFATATALRIALQG